MCSNVRCSAWQIFSGDLYVSNLPPVVIIIMAIGFITHFLPDRISERMAALFEKMPFYAQAALFCVIVLCIISFSQSGAVPFIYFQF
jgi:hypothetical protein